MAKITLGQAAQWCGGYVKPQYEHMEFTGACNDTRVLKPGQLFIALEGARDGHTFIPGAMEKGAAGALCSREVGEYPCILVEDPRVALGRIAREERRRLGCRTVAVTGSVGKSTTKEMIASVLETQYIIGKTPANHNNDIGLPMAILEMPESTQIAVLEMGMNHFREMAYLSGIGEPDVAVIVNIGTMHIEYLGSREGIRQAKLEILEGMKPEGTLLINGDDEMLNPLPIVPEQTVLRFGTTGGCEICAENIRQEPGMLRYTVRHPDGKFPVELALEGRHFVADSLAAVAVGLQMGVTPESIRLGLSRFRNMAGRQEIFQRNGMTIIRDCYNAGPESMAASLAVLGARPGRHIAVLGDMLELGDCAPEEHRKVGRIAAENAELVLAYGPNSRYVAEGAGNGLCFDSREEMAKTLKDLAREGDTLLFKASRGMRLELVLDAFLNTEN